MIPSLFSFLVGFFVQKFSKETIVMAKNDSIALSIVALGITIGVWMAIFLPADKLTLALPLPTSLIGAGLVKWQG